MATFSSLPIQPPPKNETYFDFFPAKYITQYLSEYVDKQNYCGRSLRERIRFHQTVTKVELSATNRKWQISCDGSPEPLVATNLLVAAGLTSKPNLPELPGREAFKGTISHHVDFAKSSALQDPEVKHIAVIGGAKSAADLTYAAAKAGKTVSWIVRRSGNGPAHYAPAKGIGPYKNSNDLLYTRLTASLTPSIWNHQSWLSGFLHRTRFGRGFIDWIWGWFDSNSRREAGFHGKRGINASGSGFNNLEPDTSIFWQNDSTGVNQRPDFWITISTKVHVYRQDIVQLTESSILLQEDELKAVDTIICATGWRPSYETFFSDNLADNLGLPVPINTTPTKLENPHWKALDEIAESQILHLFPRLQQPPPHQTPKQHHLSPFRLYRNLIPTNTERYSGIVFLGHISVGNNFRAAEVQGLWAVAYLSELLKQQPQQSREAEMERDVALKLAWCRKRYLSKGKLGNWLYYDLVAYTDTLLEDMGLESHRRQGGWWWWWFGGDFWKPCVAADLAGLMEELKEMSRRKQS